MHKSLSHIALIAAVALVASPGFGGTIAIGDLSSQAATRTINSKGTIGNGVFSDAVVNDGDANVSSSADITFAWDMTLLKIAPDPAGSRRSIVDLGGGGTGLSVVWNAAGIFAQTQQAPSQIGGNGSGDTAALKYVPTAADLNVERSWVVSLDVDGTSATMNLFVDNALIGSVSGVPSTDWAGGDSGGFWARGGTVLLETFGSGSGAVGPDGNDASVNLTTGLRLYEDTFVVPPAIPEPMTMLAVGMSVAGVGGYVRRRRRG